MQSYFAGWRPFLGLGSSSGHLSTSMRSCLDVPSACMTLFLAGVQPSERKISVTLVGRKGIHTVVRDMASCSGTPQLTSLDRALNPWRAPMDRGRSFQSAGRAQRCRRIASSR